MMESLIEGHITEAKKYNFIDYSKVESQLRSFLAKILELPPYENETTLKLDEKLLEDIIYNKVSFKDVKVYCALKRLPLYVCNELNKSMEKKDYLDLCMYAFTVSENPQNSKLLYDMINNTICRDYRLTEHEVIDRHFSLYKAMEHTNFIPRMKENCINNNYNKFIEDDGINKCPVYIRNTLICNNIYIGYHIKKSLDMTLPKSIVNVINRYSVKNYGRTFARRFQGDLNANTLFRLNLLPEVTFSNTRSLYL